MTGSARWNLDTAHLEVGFAVKHMMVATVRGRFSAVESEITVDEQHPARSSVVVHIKTASVDTRAAERDAHLRSADFFDAERYPEMTFRSTQVDRTGDSTFSITGDLTIRDVTRPVTMAGTIEGPLTDPWGNRRAGFNATAEIDREAFGLTWNSALEAGGVLVGRRVRLTIDGEMVEVGASAAA